MPMNDLKITLAVERVTGGGQHAETFVLPADGTPGLNLTAPQKTKLGDRLTTCGNLSDENGSAL